MDAAKIKKLVESPGWIATLAVMTPYTRTHDDHDGTCEGKLCVMFDRMGDAYVSIESDEASPPLRFRTGFSGGGNSERTRMALVILAEAMRLDELDRPNPKAT
jgi:hypothetical protein